MPRQAPRLEPRLIAALPAIDDCGGPIAETWRKACQLADLLGTPRPSYEQLRFHVHAARSRGEAKRAARDLVLDVLYRARPPEALFELLG